ncbi:hypothetical protein E2C01_078249 [Portunus trituberculatus]|uniref:Uncharacterized protein n=1 Tax=Portunus trituberculatus TaxID=210409 RepID=A0A5B7IPP5_PORTR|nr:hypothetical protein [Portunus trituberculatus]
MVGNNRSRRGQVNNDTRADPQKSGQEAKTCTSPVPVYLSVCALFMGGFGVLGRRRDGGGTLRRQKMEEEEEEEETNDEEYEDEEEENKENEK